MSSTRRDGGQSPDLSANRRTGASVKNGVDSTHGGPSLGSNGSYGQRLSHGYNDYGTGVHNVQLNGDYMNYYPSAYPMTDHYGGWGSSGGGNTGYFHNHPQAISTPVNNTYVDNLTLFSGSGSGQPTTDHSGYYYNYFPPTNGSDYSTWGSNFVTAPRNGASSKHAEFYHNPTNDYTATGGYGRGNGPSHQLDQSMTRLTVYDDPSPTGRGPTGCSGGGYHRVSSASNESRKKSWATVAGQPAKPASGVGLMGIGRGRGRGPIGGVPGSAKPEHYGVSSAISSSADSSGFWASPVPQNQQPAPQRNATNISPSVGSGQEKRSPRPVDSVKNPDNGGNWNANSSSRGNGKHADDYLPFSSTDDSKAYSKHRDPGAVNGDANEGSFNPRLTELKKTVPATVPQRPRNGAFSSTISANDYNPKEFTLPMKGARFFVIKSYSEDDVHRSIKYSIWCSTDHGNKRLDAAYRERDGKGPIYLLYSVNASGHFCGVAQMTSALDYEKSSGVWAQDKWKGQFTVKWIYVKDVPNQQLRHIRLENNENKPVTNSRDTQEVPAEKGRQVLKIVHQYTHTTSLFDDFAHYEKRQEEENARRGKRGNQDDY